MTVLIISLVAIGASLVALKVYLQEKNKTILKESVPPVEKNSEQVVYDRLQEIAKFESEVESAEVIVKEAPAKVDVVVTKETIKRKKHNNLRKHKPKAKSNK